MTEAKQQMDREFEALKASADAQLKAMEQRHERDRDALKRTGAGEELKMQRSLQPKHDAEMRQQQTHLKKEYARFKDTFKVSALPARKYTGQGLLTTFVHSAAFKKPDFRRINNMCASKRSIHGSVTHSKG